MKFSLKSIWIVALFATMVWSGCTDEPDPTATNQVTFDRYDVDSRPLGTATAWYCATDSALDYATSNMTSGDIVYLTDDAVSYTTAHQAWTDVSLICTDNDRATVTWSAGTNPQFRAANSDLSVTKLTLVVPDFYDIYLSGDEDITIINCEADRASVSALWIPLSGSSIIAAMIDCDDVRIDFGSANSTIDFRSSTWSGATDACDVNINADCGGCDESQVHILTWNYNSSRYSYEAFTTPTVTESEIVKRCPGGEQDLYVRFNVPGSHQNDNENIIDVDVEYGPTASYGSTVGACYSSSEAGWQAMFDVDSYGVNSYVYWRANVTLCDTTKVSAGQSYKIPRSAICVAPGWYDCD